MMRAASFRRLGRHWNLFTTATRYALIEHARNRLALVLIAGFIPLWSVMAYMAVTTSRVHFQLRSTGRLVTPQGNHLTEITGALNSVTLIVGFMMFAATFSGGHFDRRLSMAGYPRVHLVLAKLASLTLAAAAVCTYATAVTSCFWTPRQPIQLAAALFCAALTYGALGVALGSLLRREVEGMFTIVMISMIDLLLQNPIASYGSNSSVIVRYLPSYGAMQAGTAAGFTTTPLPRYLALQLLWFTAAAVIGLITFRTRTRTRAKARTPAPRHPDTAHTTPGPEAAQKNTTST
ncbi:ABC transporter permease [Streptomyces sp. NPDC057101]|uniref:ABC transporter permease n=1 Tax=Streptomyces sp. NPDC057101 TaxID=3346020 RepID=UPI00362A1EA2